MRWILLLPCFFLLVTIEEEGGALFVNGSQAESFEEENADKYIQDCVNVGNYFYHKYEEEILEAAQIPPLFIDKIPAQAAPLSFDKNFSLELEALGNSPLNVPSEIEKLSKDIFDLFRPNPKTAEESKQVMDDIHGLYDEVASLPLMGTPAFFTALRIAVSRATGFKGAPLFLTSVALKSTGYSDWHHLASHAMEFAIKHHKIESSLNHEKTDNLSSHLKNNDGSGVLSPKELISYFGSKPDWSFLVHGAAWSFLTSHLRQGKNIGFSDDPLFYENLHSADADINNEDLDEEHQGVDERVFTHEKDEVKLYVNKGLHSFTELCSYGDEPFNFDIGTDASGSGSDSGNEPEETSSEPFSYPTSLSKGKKARSSPSDRHKPWVGECYHGFGHGAFMFAMESLVRANKPISVEQVLRRAEAICLAVKGSGGGMKSAVEILAEEGVNGFTCLTGIWMVAADISSAVPMFESNEVKYGWTSSKREDLSSRGEEGGGGNGFQDSLTQWNQMFESVINDFPNICWSDAKSMIPRVVFKVHQVSQSEASHQMLTNDEPTNKHLYKSSSLRKGKRRNLSFESQISQSEDMSLENESSNNKKKKIFIVTANPEAAAHETRPSSSSSLHDRFSHDEDLMRGLCLAQAGTFSLPNIKPKFCLSNFVKEEASNNSEESGVELQENKKKANHNFEEMQHPNFKIEKKKEVESPPSLPNQRDHVSSNVFTSLSCGFATAPRIAGKAPSLYDAHMMCKHYFVDRSISIATAQSDNSFGETRYHNDDGDDDEVYKKLNPDAFRGEGGESGFSSDAQILLRGGKLQEKVGLKFSSSFHPDRLAYIGCIGGISNALSTMMRSKYGSNEGVLMDSSPLDVNFTSMQPIWEVQAATMLFAPRQLYEKEAAVLCGKLLTEDEDKVAFATCGSGLLSVMNGGNGIGTCFVNAAKSYEVLTEK